MMNKVINKETLIPISFVVIIASAMMGFIGWLTSIDISTKKNGLLIQEVRANIAQIKEEQQFIREKIIERNREFRSILMSIDSRLSKIEGKLDK